MSNAGKRSVKESCCRDSLRRTQEIDPELMIRTSGELRLSNFLLWQLSYAELYVTDTYWSDFREEQFFQASEHLTRTKQNPSIIAFDAKLNFFQT